MQTSGASRCTSCVGFLLCLLLSVWADAGKPAKPAPSAPPKKFRQKLTNVGDAQYTGELTIGGQTIRGIFDTGSFEVIAMSTICTNCKDHEGHPAFDPKKSSSYHKGTLLVEHVFGSGPVLTQQGFDNIKVGSMATANQTIWEIAEHRMEVLDEASFEAIIGIGPGPKEPSTADKAKVEEGIKALKDAVHSGVLPARIGQAAAENAQNPFGAISETSLLEAFQVTRFSVCLQPGKEEPGWLTWSDEDASNRPGFVKVPVIGQVHWGVQLQDVGLKGVSFTLAAGNGNGDSGEDEGGQSLMQRHAAVGHHRSGRGHHQQSKKRGGTTATTQQQHGGHGHRGRAARQGGTTAIACGNRPCAAVIDSGTSLIAAPAEALEIVSQLVQNLDPNCDNLEELPSLVFNLGGEPFELPPEAYVGKFVGVIPTSIWDILFFKPPTVKMVSGCVPLFMRMDKMTQVGQMWILGMPFFRHYYTTFDTQPERTLYMAKAAEDCTPQTAATAEKKSTSSAAMSGNATSSSSSSSGDATTAEIAVSQERSRRGLRVSEQSKLAAAGGARGSSGRTRRRPPVMHIDASKIRLPYWAMGTEKTLNF